MSGPMPRLPEIAPDHPHLLDLLLFMVGGVSCAILAERVAAIGEPEGRAVPRLAELLGIPPAEPREPARTLRFAGVAADSGDCIEVQVEEPLSLRQIPVAAIHPLPPLIGATCALPCVRALASLPEHDGLTCTLLLDPRHFPTIVGPTDGLGGASNPRADAGAGMPARLLGPMYRRATRRRS